MHIVYSNEFGHVKQYYFITKATTATTRINDNVILSIPMREHMHLAETSSPVRKQMQLTVTSSSVLTTYSAWLQYEHENI